MGRTKVTRTCVPHFLASFNRQSLPLDSSLAQAVCVCSLPLPNFPFAKYSYARTALGLLVVMLLCSDALNLILVLSRKNPISEEEMWNPTHNMIHAICSRSSAAEARQSNTNKFHFSTLLISAGRDKPQLFVDWIEDGECRPKCPVLFGNAVVLGVKVSQPKIYIVYIYIIRD